MSFSPLRQEKEAWVEVSCIETSNQSPFEQWSTIRCMQLKDKRSLFKKLKDFIGKQQPGTYRKTRDVLRFYDREILSRRNLKVAQEKARVKAIRAASFINGVKGTTLEEWLITPRRMPKPDSEGPTH